MRQRLDLVEVILELSNCTSLDKVVEVLRDRSRQLLGADGISIVLRDVDKCYYVDENAIGPLWKGRRFPMTSCVSGWCMLHKEQVAIPDIYTDPRVPHDAYRPTFVKSLAMAPIRAGDPIGAIGAYWANHHTATREELRALQSLGNSAAMAIENSQNIDALKEASRRKDAFLTMLAHELRNPLAPIRNGLHLLKLQGQNAEAVEESVEIMERQVVHLSRIIDDLLDVARINNGKIQLRRSRLDLATLLRQCVDDYRGRIVAADLSLKLEVPMSPVWINADSTRIRQVFDNILDNARKYTPGGGTIAVSLCADEATHVARVEIQDNGVGIAPQLLPRIFETFMQADTSLDRSGGGLGLGLAVANGLLKLHNGSIAAFSDGVGKGARFTVTVPDAEIEQPMLEKSRATPMGNCKQRILIIEDNKDSAHTLQKVLKVCGFEASVAYDGAEGVNIARALRPDVVLCDIGLPKMDGYAVATSLRQCSETANARLIAVTGYGSEEDQHRTQLAGFNAHLVKPIDLQALLLRLQEA